VFTDKVCLNVVVRHTSYRITQNARLDLAETT